MIRCNPKMTGSKGFTLMELIGVMAVIAILASVLAPAIFDAIDRAFAEAETENLQELKVSLINQILDNKRIPRQTMSDWVPTLAQYVQTTEEQVEFNAKGFRRRLYADPNFFGAADTVFPGYTQTTGLAAAPNSPRIMLVSDLSGNAPNPPGNGSDFDAIWNQTAGAAVVEGSDVKIVRINLRGLFHRVIFLNSNTQQPAYRLETQVAQAIPPSSGSVDGSLTRYVIEDTEVALFAQPFPTGVLTTTALVKADRQMRFTTDGSAWFWETL